MNKSNLNIRKIPPLLVGFLYCFSLQANEMKEPGPYFEIGKYWVEYAVNMGNGQRLAGVRFEVVEEVNIGDRAAFKLKYTHIDLSNNTIYDESYGIQTEEDGLVSEYSESTGEWLPIVDFNAEPGDQFPESDLWVENVETIEFMGYRRKLVRLGNHFYWSIADYWMDGVGALGGIILSGPSDVVPHVYSLIQECGKGDEVYFNLDEFYTYMGWASTPALQASEENLSEYFTLEGIRVAEPQPGQLLIRRQGTKADKVIF